MEGREGGGDEKKGEGMGGGRLEEGGVDGKSVAGRIEKGGKE